MFIAIDFLLTTPFAVSHKFWNVMFSFSLALRQFWISLLSYSWLNDYLRVCGLMSTYLWIFKFSFCYWFFCFIPLWSEKILGMILIFLNLLKLVLWPNMWSSLRDVSFLLEKNVYSAAVGWNVLYMSIRSICSIMFKPVSYWFSVCMFHPLLKLGINKVLKSPIIILLSSTPFRSVNDCFTYLSVLMLYLSDKLPL